MWENLKEHFSKTTFSLVMIKIRFKKTCCDFAFPAPFNKNIPMISYYKSRVIKK
jgi:hypothetical protein